MGSRQPNGYHIVQSTMIQTPDGTFSNRSVLQSQYQEQYSRGSRLISSRTAEFSGSPPADTDEFDAMSAARGRIYKCSNNKKYDLCLRWVLTRGGLCLLFTTAWLENLRTGHSVVASA